MLIRRHGLCLSPQDQKAFVGAGFRVQAGQRQGLLHLPRARGTMNWKMLCTLALGTSGQMCICGHMALSHLFALLNMHTQL